MKDGIAKFLPIVVGVALGWLLFHPPAWLAPLGPLRFVVMALVALVLLVVFIAFVISATIPEDVGLSAETGGIDPAMTAVADRIKALGFTEAGGPYRVAVNPAATLLPFVHASEPVYASVYRTGTVPAVLAFDFVSILEGFRGGLTTNADPRGGTMPAGPGSFRQIAKGASVEQAYRLHLEGVHWLRSRGLPAKRLSAQDFVGDFKQAMAKQRDGFRRAPLRNAVIALWRSVSKQVPHMGGLASQPAAEAQARELQTGRRG